MLSFCFHFTLVSYNLCYINIFNVVQIISIRFRNRLRAGAYRRINVFEYAV